jgi:hypothetical protein
MADHFYSVSSVGKALRRQRSDITVATSAQSSNPIELRVTDGAVSSRQLYAFCEYLADLAAARDAQVIPGGTLLV